MKQLMLALVVVLQTFFSSAAPAWSPPDAVDKAVAQDRARYLVAASDQSQNDETNEEEEEPDCE